MTNLIPTNVRSKMEEIRDNIGEFLARWRPNSRDSDLVPIQEDSFWPSRLLTGESPDVDMEDLGDEIRVMAELPGLDEKDLKIEVRNQRLLIQAEKRQDREEKSKNFYYAERRYGSVSRVLPLPCGVDVDKAKAKYKRGVLKIRLPKTEQAKTKRIDVKVH